MIGSPATPYVSLPADGRRFKKPETIKISMIPNQKLGMLIPKKPKNEPILSTHEFGRAPAQTPKGTPIIMAIKIAKNASSIVAGKRSAITVKTGSA